MELPTAAEWAEHHAEAHEFYLAEVKAGRLRVVHGTRKRTLRKKGVRVEWNKYLHAWVWQPKEPT